MSQSIHTSKKQKAHEGTNPSSSQTPKRKREVNEKSAATPNSHREPVKKKRKSKIIEAGIIDAASPFATRTTSLYLPLSPIGQRQPIEIACAEYLSPLILTHFPPLQGVVLAYSNARFTDGPINTGNNGQVILAKAIDEYAFSYAWVTADFLILTASREVAIEGYVNVQSENHLGLICWNLFNASIERSRLPKGWKWMGDGIRPSESGNGVSQEQADVQGYYVNEQGDNVDGLLQFRVRDFESVPSHGVDNGFMSIEGTMLDPLEDKQLDMQRNRGLLSEQIPLP